MQGIALDILNTYGLFLAFFAFFVALFFSQGNWPPQVVTAFKAFTTMLVFAATLMGVVAAYLLSTDENLWSIRLSGFSVVPVLLVVVGITLLGGWIVAAVALRHK